MIPAALRRREAVARGLSIRLRAEARVLLGLCAEAEAAGHGGRDLELVQRYCEVLEGWCLGERAGSELAGAVNSFSAAIDWGIAVHAFPGSLDTRRQGGDVPQLLLRAAHSLATNRYHWCAYPTHTPLHATAVLDGVSYQDDVLCELRGLRTLGEAGDVRQRLYRAQVSDIVGLARSRFAALDAMEACR